MICEKFAIDRFSSPEPVLNVMPEADAVFPKLPAEINFAVAVKTRKVNQAGFDVFQLRADFLDALHGRGKGGSRGLFPAAAIQDLLLRRNHTSGQGDALRDSGEFGVRLIVLVFRLQDAGEQSFDFREVLLGFEQSKEPRHTTSVSRPELTGTAMLGACVSAFTRRRQAAWKARR